MGLLYRVYGVGIWVACGLVRDCSQIAVLGLGFQVLGLMWPLVCACLCARVRHMCAPWLIRMRDMTHRMTDSFSWMAWLAALVQTHCNTLQHTATHCNTLQHSATPSNTLHRAHRTAIHRNTLQHLAIHYNTLSANLRPELRARQRGA